MANTTSYEVPLSRSLSSIPGERVKLLPSVVRADGAGCKYNILINKQNVSYLIKTKDRRYFTLSE